MKALSPGLIADFQTLLLVDAPLETRYSTLVALLKDSCPLVSWVGFYLWNGSDLWVGPYQGKVACLKITPPQGVCGQAFLQNRILVVPDVELFPGHIACDSLSRSEIVVPLPGRRGVLDLDSYQEAAFDAEDGELLAELLRRVESGK